MGAVRFRNPAGLRSSPLLKMNTQNVTSEPYLRSQRIWPSVADCGSWEAS